MNKLADLCKDSCVTRRNLLVKSGAIAEVEDFIGDIEELDNEVRSRESPALVMLEVEDIEDDGSKELDYESKILIRRSEHGDAAFCGGNLDFSEYV